MPMEPIAVASALTRALANEKSQLLHVLALNPWIATCLAVVQRAGLDWKTVFASRHSNTLGISVSGNEMLGCSPSSRPGKSCAIRYCWIEPPEPPTPTVHLGMPDRKSVV